MMGRRDSVSLTLENLKDVVDTVSYKKYLQRDVKIMRITGLHSMGSIFTDKLPEPTKWEALEFTLAMINLFFVVSCEANTVIVFWSEDPSFAIGTASTVLSGGLCIVQGSRLWFWRETYRHLLRRFAIMWEDSELRVRTKIENRMTAEGVHFVTKIYIIVVIMLCGSYGIRPYLLLLHYEWSSRSSNATYDYTLGAIPATYPSGMQRKNMTQYLVGISWEQTVILFVALYWIATDVMFAQLTTHAAIHFRVLRHDLEYVTEIDDNDTSQIEKIFTYRLSKIAKRHRELYTYCEMIEKIYNPIIFLAMLLAALNLCFSAFHLRKEISNGNVHEAIKSMSHAFTVIGQAFIYCVYADKLTEQSSLLAQAAYNCEWTDRTKEFKIILQTIMMRSQKPYNCTAYGFFFVNIAQMTVIAKTAGSYFTLLSSLD